MSTLCSLLSHLFVCNLKRFRCFINNRCTFQQDRCHRSKRKRRFFRLSRSRPADVSILRSNFGKSLLETSSLFWISTTFLVIISLRVSISWMHVSALCRYRRTFALLITNITIFTIPFHCFFLRWRRFWRRREALYPTNPHSITTTTKDKTY